MCFFPLFLSSIDLWFGLSVLSLSLRFRRRCKCFLNDSKSWQFLKDFLNGLLFIFFLSIFRQLKYPNNAYNSLLSFCFFPSWSYKKTRSHNDNNSFNFLIYRINKRRGERKVSKIWPQRKKNRKYLSQKREFLGLYFLSAFSELHPIDLFVSSKFDMF